MKARDSDVEVPAAVLVKLVACPVHASLFLCVSCFKRLRMNPFHSFFGLVYVVWAQSFGLLCIICVFVGFFFRSLIK